MATPVTLAAVPDHNSGDLYTEEMWKAVEAGINQGVVEQIGVQAENVTQAPITTDSTFLIEFNDATHDVYGMWDPIGGDAHHLIAPVQGWYSWDALGTWAAQSTARAWEIHVLVNDSLSLTAGGVMNNDNTHASHMFASGKLYLQAGDKVSFQALQRTGATLNLNDFTASLVRV